jgi:hypothetical protein
MTATLPGTATLRQADSVYDPLKAVDNLTDPNAVSFVASQLNDTTLNGNRGQGALACRDLTEAIQDVIQITVAQGASTLEVHIIDPFWQLLTRYGSSPAFFDVDDSGLLIPVDVNFPSGTDRWWRLAGVTLTVDPTQPHVCIFEDRIVTQLRDQGGPKHASNNQTRAEFIYSCVRSVPDIRFVCPALTAKAGSVGGDVTQGTVDTTGVLAPSASPVAASATQSNAPPARRNPAKRPGVSRAGKHNGAVWTKGGWRYTKPIGGLSPKELSILNPPTNQPDGSVGSTVTGAGNGLGF